MISATEPFASSLAFLGRSSSRQNLLASQPISRILPGRGRRSSRRGSSFGSPLCSTSGAAATPCWRAYTPAPSSASSGRGCGGAGRKNPRQCRHLRFLRRLRRFIGKSSPNPPMLKEEHPGRKITRTLNEDGRKKTKKRLLKGRGAKKSGTKKTEFQAAGFTRISFRRCQ